MIRGFRHRGLKRLYRFGDRRGVHSELADRIEEALALLDVAERPGDISLPGYRLHPLKGNLKGYWSVTVSGNWRIIFRFEDRNITDVDLIEYH
jgi:proteic killer suppression protein